MLEGHDRFGLLEIDAERLWAINKRVVYTPSKGGKGHVRIDRGGMTGPRIDPRLLDAYRRTAFVVNTPAGRLALRIGQRSVELESLLDAHGVTTWAYVTAFNPGSVRSSGEANAARQLELASEVTDRGCVSYLGEGVGDDGGWPPEPSVLILGINRDEAARLGRRFGQLAVVYGERGREAELLACEDRPE